MARCLLHPLYATAAIALAALSPVAAQTQALSDSYEACMRLARQEPAKGLSFARAWHKENGDTGARHCAGTALAGLGKFAEAAAELESLAWALPTTAPDRVRAQILAQAGRAWLDAGKLEQSNALLTTAVDLAPNDPEIRIDRAVAHAAAGRYQDAVIDLSAALIADRESVDALVLRANAYRQSGRLEPARADIERALAIAPGHAEGLLERGLLRQMSGDAGGARADWRTLIKLHGAQPAADAARRHLQALDAKAAPKR